MTRREAFLSIAAAPLALAASQDRIVVPTFDDSAITHATFVAPLLKQNGFGATFFVCEFPPDFEDKTKYMRWEQVKALSDMGFEIGSHTRTHTHVTRMNSGQFHAELKYIEDKCAGLGMAKPVSFAYPAYETNAMATEVLTARGYKFARAGGGRTYNPAEDSPLLIPSFSTTGTDPRRVLNILDKARPGQIVVLTVHGVPDYAHPNVTTPPELFETYIEYLHENDFRVIALRDLAQLRS